MPKIRNPPVMYRLQTRLALGDPSGFHVTRNELLQVRNLIRV